MVSIGSAGFNPTRTVGSTNSLVWARDQYRNAISATDQIRPNFNQFFRGGAPDPLNFDYAIERLRALLEQDGDNGPRQDVPQQGYYLNILI